MNTRPSAAFAANAVVKVFRALPTTPGAEGLSDCLSAAQLQIYISSLLPTHGVYGLGAAQQSIIFQAVDCLEKMASRALQTPRTHLNLGHIDLLRALAQDSKAEQAEYEFVARGHCLMHDFSTHRHASHAVLKNFADGLACAELSYSVLLEGLRGLRTLAAPAFFESLDEGLPLIALCNAAWAFPILFDGLRLRRGLAAATRCLLRKAHVDASDTDDTEEAPEAGGVEEDAVAATLLSDGECLEDRDRVLSGALFFLAASREALLEYESVDEHDSRETLAPLWEGMEARIRLHLERCREEHEQRAQNPGKAMRLVIETFAEMLEGSLTQPSLGMLGALAFAFPCLVPSGLVALDGYDGGLLNTWDACDHLLQLHARLTGEVMPLHTLLCAVLGGVVGNLAFPQKLAGPFVIHPSCAVMERAKRIRKTWPSPRASGGHGKTGGVGKMVSANAVVCGALETGHYRCQHQSSLQSVARADAALIMGVLAESLGPGAHTTDSLLPLRRLYIAALHFEPMTPQGPSAPASGAASATECSPMWPTAAGPLPRTVPHEQIDTVWRAVNGGSLTCAGMLFCFTRQAFADSLSNDWATKEQVQKALRDRELGICRRADPVMSSAEAVALVCRRASQHVAFATQEVDAIVHATDGPRNVSRAVEALSVWAKSAYSEKKAGGWLWESLIVALCPYVSKRKTR